MRRTLKRTLSLEDVLERGLIVQGVHFDCHVRMDFVQYGRALGESSEVTWLELEVSWESYGDVYVVLPTVAYPLKLALESFRNEHRLLHEDFKASVEAHARVTAALTPDAAWNIDTGDDV